MKQIIYIFCGEPVQPFASSALNSTAWDFNLLCARAKQKLLGGLPSRFLNLFQLLFLFGVVFGLDGFDLPPSRVPLSFRDFIRDASFSESLKPACSAAPLSIGNHGKPNIHQNQILTYCKVENKNKLRWYPQQPQRFIFTNLSEACCEAKHWKHFSWVSAG